VSHDEEKSLKPVLVSACLLGRECRYDGAHNADALLSAELEARGERAIPFCPEEHGGLGTPRPPAWIESKDAAAVLAGDARVVTDDGEDVTANFLDGARGALDACTESGATRAYLKERSPSCGACSTHVAGELTDGPGVTTALLQSAGVEVEGVAGRRG
jgi:uncharacterized protein YbbK (DUF523 family)